MARTIYISYFWLNEPLVQTQVLPYLRELKKGGVDITFLTYEREPPKDEEKIREQLAAEGIEWRWLKYHKRFSILATTWDILCGALLVRNLIGRTKADVLHGRSHVPTLIAAIARRISLRNPKILFDIRGFFPEEYVDAGIWKAGGWMFTITKRVEKWLMNEADGFVVLSEAAREILFPESRPAGFDRGSRPVEVIPCCVDLETRFSGDQERFRADGRKRLNVEGRYVVTHIGSLGGVYLTLEMADLLAAAKKVDPTTFALFLAKGNNAMIESLLSERGFSSSDYFVGQAKPDEMESYLCISDAAISFVHVGNARASRSPTKIPEYLACGLPIIANPGIGDVDKLLTQNGVGVLLEGLDPESYRTGIESLKDLGDIADQCRKVAVREFELTTVGGPRYRRIYERLLARSEDPSAIDCTTNGE